MRLSAPAVVFRMAWMALVCLMIAALPSGVAAAGHADKRTLAEGKKLYQSECAVCHGIEGKGDGPAAYLLYPKPRDFTRGIFKLRSTLALPTDDDLFRTITQGMPGSAMPSWDILSEAERRALVAYVKTFSTAFKGGNLKPIAIPAAPKESPALLDEGRQLFKDAGCIECHGKTGRGDGPSAPTLKDDWGNQIVPYDFTIPGRMKGGYTPSDLFKTLTVGVGGTPMPSYSEALNEEQRWAVAYYALSLSKASKNPLNEEQRWALTYYALSLAKGSKRPLGQASGGITSAYLPGELPRDPMDRAWQRIEPLAVRVQALWSRKASISEVTVRSLHNDKRVAFLLEWADDTLSQGTFRPQDFSDGAAIEFPLSSGNQSTPPSVAMGETQRPVDIWYWKAQWELELGETEYHGLQAAYPRLDVDYYPFQDDTFLTGLGAGNPMSPQKRTTSVQHLNAAGPGTITVQAEDDQGIVGRGVWSEGRWHVVMMRDLRPPGPQNTPFDLKGSKPVAFAIWSGAERDRDGQKQFSGWQRLVFAGK